MARKIDVRRILEEKLQGRSNNAISSGWHISKHSVGDVVLKAEEMGILPGGKIPDLDDESLYKLFFPDKQDMNDVYAEVDYDYVHSELNKPGVTLKLLWKEHKADILCSSSPKAVMSYSKFCRGYSAYADAKGFANHIIHKAGDRIEVDWSGPTMHYTSPQTGRRVTVYLFVADLVSSRLAFVEPTLRMDEKIWIQCHVDMWNYFGGVSRVLVCDNLLTGVQHHPREGEIVLTKEYEQLAEHYGTGILPCIPKAPRQKNSTENTVYLAALGIIARLRNIEFRSFNELRKAVAEKLEEINNEPFEKRLGSRRSDFEENERHTLKPLPEVPYEVGTWVYNRKVQPNCHVSYLKNWYSVPHAYQGRSVDLRVTTGEVQIFVNGQLVKRHLLFDPDIINKYSTDAADMPDGSGFTEWTAERILRWARSFGPSTTSVIEKILDSKPVVEQTFNSALAVLQMSKRYGKEQIEEASGVALTQVVSPRYHQLKAILASNSGKRDEDKPPMPKGILKGADYFASFGGYDD